MNIGIFKDLFTEKTRMILTILAIAWGTFSIASMLAIGQGLRTTFGQAVANSGHNYLSLQGGYSSINYQGIHANQPINLTKQDYRAIESLPTVRYLSPFYELNADLKYGKNKMNMTIQAVNHDYGKIRELAPQSGGRFISAHDVDRKRNVIFLGTKAKSELFKDEDPVGKIILVNSKPFLVIGVMKKKNQLAAREAPDAFMNWIPSSTYEKLNNPLYLGNIVLMYHDANDLEPTKLQIQKVIALLHHVDPNDDYIIHFKDLAKAQDRIDTFFMGMQIFLGIVGFLTLFIAAVGISNVMYASVKKATHEIGIRMAVGARTYQILNQYIAESLVATFLGGIIGMIMTAVLVIGIDQIPMKGKIFEVIGQPRPILSWSVILIVIFVLGVVGFFAGLFPAIQATKVDPAEALIYE